MSPLEAIARRGADAEERAPMMLLEALLLAVECLQEHGAEREQAEAARLLDRKAMKLRARQAATTHFETYCFCGNERPPGWLLCPACHSAIPLCYLLAWHAAPAGGMKAAMQEINDWCRMRRARRVA